MTPLIHRGACPEPSAAWFEAHFAENGWSNS